MSCHVMSCVLPDSTQCYCMHTTKHHAVSGSEEEAEGFIQIEYANKTDDICQAWYYVMACQHEVWTLHNMKSFFFF